MSEKIDPIQLSFDNQKNVETLCRIFLENKDVVPISLEQQLRIQYKIALCEIGEPPIPPPERVRQAEEIRRLQQACLRADGESDWMM